MTAKGIGNFLAALVRASRALAADTFQTSKTCFPAFNRCIQKATAPLPLPIRTSLGFWETGVSAKIRISILFFFVSFFAITRRAASICLGKIRFALSAFKAVVPNKKSHPPFEYLIILTLIL
jgi:hypothetical protein